MGLGLLGMMGMMGGGLGANAGVATGRIDIDLTRLQAAQASVARAASEMGRSMSSVGAATTASTNTQVSAWGRVSAAINKAGQTAIFVASAVTGMGVKGANELTRMSIGFRYMAGGAEEAAALMSELEVLARRTGTNLWDMQEAAVALLPAARAGNTSISEMILLANRLILKNPFKDFRDAAFSLNELLAGQTISLKNQFNISGAALRDITARAGDDQTKLLELLGEYLTSIGITEDAITEMGESGVNASKNVRQEWKLTLAQAFQPTARVVNTILQAFADLAVAARSSNSELLRVLATLTAMVVAAKSLTVARGLAAGIPVVGPVVSQVIPVGVAGKVAKVGLAGATAYAGAEVGAQAVRWMGDLGVGGKKEQEYYKQADVSDLGTIFKVLLVGLVEQIGDVLAAFVGVIESGGDWVREAMWDVSMAFVDVLQFVVDIFNELASRLPLGIDDLIGRLEGPEVKEPAGAQILYELFSQAKAMGLPSPDVEQAEFVNEVLEEWRDTGRDISDIVHDVLDPEHATAGKVIAESIRVMFDDAAIGLAEWLGLFDEFAETEAPPVSVSEPFVVSEEMLTAFQQFQDDLAGIDASEQAARLKAEDEFQRALTREAEDEHVRRVRAEESLQRSITDVWSELSTTIEDLNVAYQERVAEVTESYEEGEAKRREDHYRALERMERQHRENLLTAAAKLDAFAVWREQQQYRRSRDEAAQAYDEETIERRAAYEEQLTDLRTSHEEQLTEAREAAEERIKDLREEFAESERLYAEDRALRLAREKEDYDRQLQDQKTQYENQRTERNKAFTKELNALLSDNALKLAITKQGLSDMETEFRKWFEAQAKAISGAAITGGGVTGEYGEELGRTEGRYVDYMGYRVRVDMYDPNYAAGMSASQWYLWKLQHGYQRGGYTGGGLSSDVAGVVHRREYVVPEQGALVVHSERTTNVLDRLGGVVAKLVGLLHPTKPPETPPMREYDSLVAARLLPRARYPVEPTMIQGGRTIGDIKIEIHEAIDAAQTARVVRAELMNVLVG